ncbi:MAG TPA: SDR family oxidoreductase [Candidatus Acidoferrales bacterium]|jgi:2-deoxy-D-gluconate 3-dehydrogenase|nr:SDR family oxidoreductase [Candidatus Acidoferrales bacterium]
MTSSTRAADELPSFRLDGRLAVITGASDGIGRAFALAYARSGAEVVLVSRRREKLLEVQRSIEVAGGRAHLVPADVGKIEDIRSLEQEVSRIISPKDQGQEKGRDRGIVLVNCAGFGFTKPALDITEQDWDRILDVHAKGTFFCCQSMGRLMIERGYGKIINLSSTWSVSTDMGKSVYGIAKAGVSYLTAALSTEWAPLGVRVNAIAPTSTLTENTSRSFREDEVRAQRLLSRIKLGRFAEPSDLVGAALFLASPASDFVTGHTLFVDGGWQTAL